MMKAICYVALPLVVSSMSARALAKDYKSGEYITTNRYGFGAFEARIRAAEGPGVISTFFLWKPGSETPSVPWEEIDFEMGPARGDYQTQIMTPAGEDQGGREEHNLYYQLPTEPWEAYYTFRMEWTPDYIAFFLDGVELRRETDPQEFAALFNTDQNGDTPANERMELRVGVWPALPNIYEWAGEFDASSVPTAVFVDYVAIWDYTPNQADEFSTLLLYDEFDSVTSNWYKAQWTFEYSASDYVPQNIGTKDGRLVVSLTTAAGQGHLPNPPPDVSTPPYFIVEAENYDDFYDTKPGNSGDSRCSDTDVDAGLVQSDPTGGRCYVGWTEPGEWLEYELELDEDASFDLVLRIASLSAAGDFYVEVDGVDVSGLIPGPGNGWQAFSDVIIPEVLLSAGVHTVGIVFDTGRVNVNYLKFVRLDVPPDDGGSDNGGNPSAVAGLTLTADWGNGYCADLVVSTSTGVSDWLVTVGTPGAVVYTSWNANLTGSSPTYEVGPVAWNANIAPGQSRTVGFCANRTSAGSLPKVIAVQGF